MACTSTYSDHRSHDCISKVSTLFDGIAAGDVVQAEIFKRANPISYESISEVHNYLHSSNSWVKVQGWEDEVEYTISNPNGDVLAYDTAHGSTRLRVITSGDKCFSGVCGNGTSSAIFRRVVESEVREIDFNMERFSHVKVMKVKRFFYETARSSFIYRLVILWEGETVEVAKASLPKFMVFLETNDACKMGRVPEQSCVSFMEKTLDLLSEGARCVLVVDERMDEL